jgi:hypothetical protein
LGIDIENMRPWLESAGLKYFDSLEEAQR